MCSRLDVLRDGTSSRRQDAPESLHSSIPALARNACWCTARMTSRRSTRGANVRTTCVGGSVLLSFTFAKSQSLLTPTASYLGTLPGPLAPSSPPPRFPSWTRARARPSLPLSLSLSLPPLFLPPFFLSLPPLLSFSLSVSQKQVGAFARLGRHCTCFCKICEQTFRFISINKVQKCFRYLLANDGTSITLPSEAELSCRVFALDSPIYRSIFF